MNAVEYCLLNGLKVSGPGHPAILSAGESLSYGALAARVSQFAAGLRDAGVKPRRPRRHADARHARHRRDASRRDGGGRHCGGHVEPRQTPKSLSKSSHRAAGRAGDRWRVRRLAVPRSQGFAADQACPPRARTGRLESRACRAAGSGAAQAERSGVLGDDLRHHRRAQGGGASPPQRRHLRGVLRAGARLHQG